MVHTTINFHVIATYEIPGTLIECISFKCYGTSGCKYKHTTKYCGFFVGGIIFLLMSHYHKFNVYCNARQKPCTDK